MHMMHNWNGVVHYQSTPPPPLPRNLFISMQLHAHRLLSRWHMFLLYVLKTWGLVARDYISSETELRVIYIRCNRATTSWRAAWHLNLLKANKRRSKNTPYIDRWRKDAICILIYIVRRVRSFQFIDRVWEHTLRARLRLNACSDSIMSSRNDAHS